MAVTPHTQLLEEDSNQVADCSTLTSQEKNRTSTLLPNLLPGDPVTIMGPYVAGTTAYHVKPTMPSTSSTII